MYYVFAGIVIGFIVEPLILHANLASMMLRVIMVGVIAGFAYGLVYHEPFRKACKEGGMKFLTFLGKLFFGGYHAVVSVFVWVFLLFLYGTFGVLSGNAVSELQQLAFVAFYLLLFGGIGAGTLWYMFKKEKKGA